jgi:heptosyltransferase II
VQQLRAKVLVLCGPGEREAAAVIEKQADQPSVRSLAQRPLSVGLTKACLRRCRLLVSTDSGPRHIAAALEVPVVALFGPTDPRWSGNGHAREIALKLSLNCQPCSQRTCPLEHHRCMRDLQPEIVLAAVRRLFEAAAADAA